MMILLPKQENAVYYLKDDTTEELLYGGAAGGGKSALGCLWLIENCQKYPKSRWLMGRSKLKTLKETTLATFFELISTLKIFDDFDYNDKYGVITYNKNGSEIILKDLMLYPADPNFDSLGSLEITGAFIDECNQITYKAWQIVKSRIRFKLTEFGLIPKMLGTCNPSKNWPYLEFYQAKKKTTLKAYRRFIQALPTDNPHLHPSYLQSLLRLDENSKRRLYYGDWEYDDDPSALMPFDKITDIFTNSFVSKGEKFIIADIARLGRDNTCIGLWDGFRCEQIINIEKNKVTEAAQEIASMAALNNVPLSNILVDEDGVGGGVVDILACNGFVNNSTPLDNEEGERENFNNLKSQCYFKLAEYVNKALIFVNVTDPDIKSSIIQELEQVKQHNMDKDAKKQVMPKDKVKELLGRSPDLSDMIMMRMWFVYRKQFDLWLG